MIFNRLSVTPWLAGEPAGPAAGGVFVVWKTDCHRSLMTARCFGTDIWFVSTFAGTAAWKKILRYAVSFFTTIGLLYTRRPSSVFILNQPTPLIVAALTYTLPFGKPLVLDCHSNAYAPGRNAISAWFYRWATRRALFSVNHNRLDQGTVLKAGGESVLIPEIPASIDVKAGMSETLKPRNVLTVCSFAADEPVDVIFAAARLLPDVHFYFTGNFRKFDPAIIATAPPNVEFLGFIPRDLYMHYAATTDVIVSLSYRSHIMQTAAEESICLVTPLVSNKSAVLQEVFGHSALFVDIDAARIAKAIRITLKYKNKFRTRLAVQRDARRDHLRRTLKTIAETKFASAARAG